MSRVIDQRLISSAMLAALAEHDGARIHLRYLKCLLRFVYPIQVKSVK